MQEEFDSKGLTILSVSGQDKDTVQAFVEQHGATFPVFAEANAGAYSTGGVPSAALIAPDGTVAFVGHPAQVSDDQITELLGQVAKADRVSTKAFLLARALPAFPAKLSSVEKDLAKDKYGKALTKVEKALPKLAEEDQAAGEQIREWIERKGKDGMERAAKLVRKGKIYEGFLAYEEVEELFKGHTLGKDAKAAISTMEKDKSMKLEIKASERWEKIKVELRTTKKPKDQLKLIAPLCSKKYEETAAGKEAAKMETKLKAMLK